MPYVGGPGARAISDRLRKGSDRSASRTSSGLQLQPGRAVASSQTARGKPVYLFLRSWPQRRRGRLPARRKRFGAGVAQTNGGWFRNMGAHTRLWRGSREGWAMAGPEVANYAALVSSEYEVSRPPFSMRGPLHHSKAGGYDDDACVLQALEACYVATTGVRRPNARLSRCCLVMGGRVF